MEVEKAVGFDWNQGNLLKNWEKHGVKYTEAEEIFNDKDRKIYKDVKHSTNEDRYLALGKTAAKRKLAVDFVFRGKRIRIISARAMSKKEKIVYEKRV